MALIQITVSNAGGEYSGGLIDDEDQKSAILSAIDDGRRIYSHFIEDDDDADFASYNHDDLFHVYGPCAYGGVLVETCDNPDEEDEFSRDWTENSDLIKEDTEVNWFTSANPYVRSSEYKEGDLVVLSQQVEKRMHYPVTLEVEGQIDLSDIWVGSINMDETISDDEIVDCILQITKETQTKYLKACLGDDYSEEDEFSDYIGDIFMEKEHSKLKEDLLEECELEAGDIYGKGETENDYIKIVSASEDEILYEDGEY